MNRKRTGLIVQAGAIRKFLFSTMESSGYILEIMAKAPFFLVNSPTINGGVNNTYSRGQDETMCL